MADRRARDRAQGGRSLPGVRLALFMLPLALASCRAEETSRRSEPRAATAPQAERAPEPSALPRGEVEVSFGVDGIVARANSAPRRALLEALARETGLLAVSFVEGGDPDGAVTLDSLGEPIEVVVARALPGVPYSLEPLEAEGRLRIALVVGKRRAEPPRVREGRRERERERDTLDPREREERVERLEEQKAAALEKLESSDPRERVEGVEWADTTTVAGFEAVVERLANDPDAVVRAAAAESLAAADVGAVRPLLTALSDPDTRVVLAALDSLETLGDESVLPGLAPAFEHPDPAVRERAEEVEDFLK